jgi:hypothetical protein
MSRLEAVHQTHVEITPEMIRAGAAILENCGWFEPLHEIAMDLARQILEAAISSRNAP